MGGGRIFGPQPKDYSYSINRKARQEALKSAILSKIIDQEVFILDSFALSGIKTKEVVNTLQNLKINKSCLICTASKDDNLFKSIRNIPSVDLDEFRNLNAFNVLRYKYLLLTKEAAQMMKEKFSGSKTQITESAENAKSTENEEITETLE